jgi:hypothetical protein
MGELLDREYQRHILRTCANEYPTFLQSGRFGEEARSNRLLVNACYLHELGLLSAKVTTLTSGEMVLTGMVITAKGLDFLQGDGGLSAILGVVTVKLHDDTIRQLLISKIESSDADQSIKGKLIEAVKEAPAEALKTITQRAVEEGLRNLPNALPLIQTWLNLV